MDQKRIHSVVEQHAIRSCEIVQEGIQALCFYLPDGDLRSATDSQNLTTENILLLSNQCEAHSVSANSDEGKIFFFATVGNQTSVLQPVFGYVIGFSGLSIWIPTTIQTFS